MLSLLLLSFGGITAVLELIGPTARLLSHRVADWMKMRSAMRHYLQERPAIPRSRRSCNVQYPNTTIIIPRADDVGFRDVAGEGSSPALVRSGSATRDT